MGLYINPTNDLTKEEWLEQHGTKLFNLNGLSFERLLVAEGKVIVSLVQNPDFSAAAIAFDKYELGRFMQPTDYRKKTWYLVHIDKLRDHSGISDQALRQVGLIHE